MEFQFYGANCLRITAKKASVVVDDNLKSLGQHAITKADDIAVFTTPLEPEKAAFIIDSPGEYEISGISIMGISARAHVDEVAQKTATMYKLISDDLRVVVLGHIYPDLTDGQLESLGMVDVLIVPVGGNGYTLDPVGALKLIKKIEPRIVIPTHYAQKGLNFPVPQQDLTNALKELAMEPTQTVQKLKLRSVDIPENTQLIVLEPSN